MLLCDANHFAASSDPPGDIRAVGNELIDRDFKHLVHRTIVLEYRAEVRRGRKGERGGRDGRGERKS